MDRLSEITFLLPQCPFFNRHKNSLIAQAIAAKAESTSERIAVQCRTGGGHS